MAVVRVKRHCDEEPIDALLITCKRRKTEDDQLTSLFKFTTTVNNQEENVSKHISKVLSSEEGRAKYKMPNIPNITEKLRAEHKIFSQESRLKVVNCFRALDGADCLADDGPSESSGSLTILDIESQRTTSSESATNKPVATTSSVVEGDDTPDRFVYDIYYAPDCKLDEKALDNELSCHPIDALIFEDYGNEVYDNDDGDSDDSNDENNWRNDYPDEDPDSIGEDDMNLACGMGDLNLSDRNSLSSDDGEAELVYGMDDPDYIPGLDPDLVKRFGYNYAAYKKRVTDLEDSDHGFFVFEVDSDMDSDDLI